MIDAAYTQRVVRLRCLHKSLVITEHFKLVATHSYNHGKWSHGSEDWPTGVFSVKCHDCGLERTYREGGQVPKWVEGRYLEAIGGEWHINRGDE